MYPKGLLLSLLTLLCWLPALQAATGEHVELTQTERAWLEANPRILLGSDAHWRPFVWRRDDGSAAGIEADLIARINALTGANIQLVLGEWADMVARAEAGELHGLAASASHAERADRFLFSASPYSTHKFIFTRQGGPIASMDDLSGRRVGVLRENLSDLKLLDARPAIVQVEFDSPLALAVAVQNGAVDAAISSANLQWTATENVLADLRLAFPVPGSRIDLRYSILKQHAPLLGIVDKALHAIDPAVMMGILRKWGDEEQPNIPLGADERAWLDQKHTVRVRIGDHPPWEINSPGADGMAVDYLRIIGKLFDIDFRFVPAEDSWGEGFDDMAGAHRHYDLLPAAKRTEQRLATLAMSEDYLSSPWMIFARRDRDDIHTLGDLRGRTVAVERGYVMQGLLESTEPAIVLSVKDSTKDALLAVSNGSADAYVGNLLVTDYLLQADGIVNLEVAGPTPFGEHRQAMVTRKAWAPLISLIDKGLNAIPAEQHIAIRQRWLASVADGGMQAPLDLSADERAWIAAHPTIRVGAYALPPFILEHDGQVDGYLVELMRTIAARAGLRAEFHFLPLEQVKEGTERGTLDATLAVNPTPERKRVLLLSAGTVEFTLSIFARKEADDIEGLESLAGKTLATYPGYSWNARFPEALPHTRIVTAADVEGMFRMVASGEADAAIFEVESGRALLRRTLLTNVEPKAVAVFDGQRSRRGHYFGVSRRVPLLASILDKSFAGIPEAEKQRLWEPLVCTRRQRRRRRARRRGARLPGCDGPPPGPCLGVGALRLCRRRGHAARVSPRTTGGSSATSSVCARRTANASPSATSSRPWSGATSTSTPPPRAPPTARHTPCSPTPTSAIPSPSPARPTRDSSPVPRPWRGGASRWGATTAPTICSRPTPRASSSSWWTTPARPWRRSRRAAPTPPSTSCRCCTTRSRASRRGGSSWSASPTCSSRCR